MVGSIMFVVLRLPGQRSNLYISGIIVSISTKSKDRSF